MRKKLRTKIDMYLKKVAIIFMLTTGLCLMVQSYASTPLKSGDAPDPAGSQTEIKNLENEIQAIVSLFNLQTFGVVLPDLSNIVDNMIGFNTIGQASAVKTGTVMQKEVTAHLSQLNSSFLLDPNQQYVTGGGLPNTQHPDVVFNSSQNLLADSLIIPSADSIFSGKGSAGQFGTNVMKHVIGDMLYNNPSTTPLQKKALKPYYNDLMNSPGKGSLNFQSLFMPKTDQSYSPVDAKTDFPTKDGALAHNYLTILTNSYGEYYSKLLKALEGVKNNLKDVASPQPQKVIAMYKSIMEAPVYQRALLQIRTMTAEKSVASSVLQAMYQERAPQDKSGRSALYYEKQMATERLTDPSWVKKMETAPMSVVQREQLIISAQQLSLKYKQLQSSEKVQALLAVLVLQNTRKEDFALRMDTMDLKKIIDNTKYDSK